MEYTPFNINESVKVKLTDFGRTKLKERHDKLYRWYKDNGHSDSIPKYVAPVEDNDGYSEWQLWCLMEALGEHVHMGCNHPFETEILISTKENQ